MKARGLLHDCYGFHRTEAVMLSWAIGFFLLALVAAFFGFGGIASSAAGIAKVLLVLFVIAFVVSLIFGLRGRSGVSRRDLF
jgi:uncharacterized membrane protein YtjA (UPF0391 family)